MQARGFTLIEALVVMTISAILVAMAVPAFQSIIRSSRISSASNSMLAALDLARSEAIRRASLVTFCRSTNSDQPNADCSSGAANGFVGTDWAAGWLVFAKAPGNAVATAVEVNDEIILRHSLNPAGGAVERMIIESNLPNPQALTFNARGIGGGNAATMFIDQRDTQVAVRSVQARCLVLNFIGRARVARVVNDACPAA